MARRAASIWRAVIRPRPVAFRPNSPKDTWVPRVARPVLRPLCSLRYFLREGCSMIILLQVPGRLRPCEHHDHVRDDGLPGDRHGDDANDALRHGAMRPRAAFRRWAAYRLCKPRL